MLSQFLFLPLLFCVGTCTVHFSEHFDDKDSMKNWVLSTHHPKEVRGSLSISSTSAWSNKNLGLKTDEDARFYAISAKLPTAFTNKGKTLVVQYTVKYDKSVSCGGAYLKLLKSDVDQTDFHGDTPYLFMFGPDICGYGTKKVHAIFNYKGKNHLIKKDVRCKDDTLSHLYTFILTPDNKYKILIDNEQVQDGSLEDDWDMLPPKEIDDPAAKKPEDWVDEEKMDDPDDKKPEDWDKPETIPDPDAKKPEDWDDEMDGIWEPPKITNPEFKGEWQPKKIDNPRYKGPWIAPQIDNPDYKHDDELYVMNDVGVVGFELWQLTAESIFDDILITDDPEFAKKKGEELWRVLFNEESEYERKQNEKLAEESKSEEKEEADESDDSESPATDTEPKDESKDVHEEL